MQENLFLLLEYEETHGLSSDKNGSDSKFEGIVFDCFASPSDNNSPSLPSFNMVSDSLATVHIKNKINASSL